MTVSEKDDVKEYQGQPKLSELLLAQQEESVLEEFKRNAYENARHEILSKIEADFSTQKFGSAEEFIKYLDEYKDSLYPF
jgi:hypothetical protein